MFRGNWGVSYLFLLYMQIRLTHFIQWDMASTTVLIYLFVCSLRLLDCIIFWGHNRARDAMPPVYQHTGTHFANFRRMTG